MQVDRLLSMMLMISKKERVTGKELAEHFEVSLRTVYRDIDKLCAAGLPIASEGGKGGGFYMMEDYSPENIALKKDEMLTLKALMDNLGFLLGRHGQFNDIMAKLEAAGSRNKTVKDILTINMSHFSMEKELKEYLHLISQAIDDSLSLELEYINRRHEYEKREVLPYYIDFSSGEWYLVGFCKVRNAFRRFKLVRIRSMKTGKCFVKQELSIGDISRIIREDYGKKSIRVLMRFSSRIGAHLKEYFPEDAIKHQADGSCLVEDRFPHEEGLTRFLLGFGNECEVLEPEYLRAEVKKYLTEMLRKYND
ncbi:MAG: helix-turn-helix transcriptional regulator [Pseudomonadota bacterium]